MSMSQPPTPRLVCLLLPRTGRARHGQTRSITLATPRKFAKPGSARRSRAEPRRSRAHQELGDVSTGMRRGGRPDMRPTARAGPPIWPTGKAAIRNRGALYSTAVATEETLEAFIDVGCGGFMVFCNSAPAVPSLEQLTSLPSLQGTTHGRSGSPVGCCARSEESPGLAAHACLGVAVRSHIAHMAINNDNFGGVNLLAIRRSSRYTAFRDDAARMAGG